jgi:hypothetical protein
MSSLAFNAAPFDYDNTDSNNTETNNIDRKRLMKNKTIKRKPSTPTKQNVESMLKQINQYKSMGDDYDDDENISDFKPPPKPLSRTQLNDSPNINLPNSNSHNSNSHNSNSHNSNSHNSNSHNNNSPNSPDTHLNQHDDVDVENFQNLPTLVADDYYRQYVPYFDRINESGNGGLSKDDLLKKLDYMIHLLEEQQETKTNTVTEEVILYSFLGVFVIFVLDSFARASKYVR